MAKESSEIVLAGIHLSKTSLKPLYVQVYEQVREMILTNRFRPGDRLPASRNLSTQLNVSRVIISQAFELLIMEGYLVAKTGSGTYVAGARPDDLLNAGNNAKSPQKKSSPASANLPNHSILPFQLGSPALDSFPYKTWHQVGNSILKHLKNYFLGYDDCLGYWPLRQAIASYLRMSRAVNCEADQVLIVTGSQQGLNLVIESLLQKNDQVWMEDPGYFGARLAFDAAGVTICPVPVQSDGLDVNAGIRKYHHAKLAYITPSHQFPLGYTLSHSKRMQLLKWAHENNSWIFEDDYDSEFRYQDRPLPSLQGLDTNGRVIYSGTFSKVLFPGLRLAYLVLPSKTMVDTFKSKKENIDRQSPVLDQLILCRFMEQGHFLRHIRKMRLLYAGRQQVLASLLATQTADYLSFMLSPSGMHIICWLVKKTDIQTFRGEAGRQGLVISFINDYSISHKLPPAIALCFTAFSAYRLRIAVQKLLHCLQFAAE